MSYSLISTPNNRRFYVSWDIKSRSNASPDDIAADNNHSSSVIIMKRHNIETQEMIGRFCHPKKEEWRCGSGCHRPLCRSLANAKTIIKDYNENFDKEKNKLFGQKIYSVLNRKAKNRTRARETAKEMIPAKSQPVKALPSSLEDQQSQPKERWQASLLKQKKPTNPSKQGLLYVKYI